MKLLIMMNPAFLRICREGAIKLAQAELRLCCVPLEVPPDAIAIRNIAGIDYFSISRSTAFSEKEITHLSRLSFAYAIFEEVDGLLRPLRLIKPGFIGDSISSILKYPGKTNELFTRLLIHVALLSCKCLTDSRPILLDPVSGKGTTLFEGLVAGCDVHGIEILEKPVHEAFVYFKKYLETGKYRHNYRGETKNGKAVKLHHFDFAATKQELKDSPHHLSMIVGDSANADSHYKKNYFHLIVGDLPYGVAHGNVAKRKQSLSPTRSPSELLNECLPAWHYLLKPGGVVALSWNSFVLSRDGIREVISKNNFESLEGSFYDCFEHRVDQAIRRDIIIARKR